MSQEQLKREVKFRMPYDKRHKDPDKNQGIGAMDIFFILQGEKGAVQVLIGTNCYLVNTIKEYQAKGKDLFFKGETFTCFDVGYHSPTPKYEDQMSVDCDLFNQGYCYYDGSSLRGLRDQVADGFLAEGEEFIWRYLEKEYYAVFGK